MDVIEAYKEAKRLNRRSISMYLESLRLLAIRSRALGISNRVSATTRADAIRLEKKATDTKENLIYDWSH